jgi:hypothetical protein
MHRETFIEKLTEIQQTVGQLLAQLQASEHDKFVAHLYRSRREYRSACQRAGKSGKQIERCVISTFQVAESMGFKGDFRQWEHLLRVDDPCIEDPYRQTDSLKAFLFGQKSA